MHGSLGVAGFVAFGEGAMTRPNAAPAGVIGSAGSSSTSDATLVGC
jgi:hypothetical protein